MELLKNIRAYEDVFFEDPEENPDTPRFRVWFDDKHIEEYLAKVGNAIDRAQANEQMAREADTPEKAAATKTPFAVATPTHTPDAARRPWAIAVLAIRKKSTPGMSSARKCARATAANCSMTLPAPGDMT